MDIPKIDIYHYELDIKPEKCPRRVNRYLLTLSQEVVRMYFFIGFGIEM